MNRINLFSIQRTSSCGVSPTIILFLSVLCSLVGCNAPTSNNTGDGLSSKPDRVHANQHGGKNDSKAREVALINMNRDESIPTSNASDSPPKYKGAVTIEQKSTTQKTGQEKVAAPKRATENQIAKWNLPDFDRLELLGCYDGFNDDFLKCMDVSADGTSFVVGGELLTVWRIGESEPHAELFDNASGEISRRILCTAISPDGQWVAAGDSKGTLRVWSLKEHRQVINKKAHDSRLSQIAFSTDSQQLATTSYSGVIRLWNPVNGKRLTSFKAGDQEVDQMVFLSPDSLACVGGQATIWNTETRKRTKRLAAKVYAEALAVSPNGKWLAYGDRESSLNLWDVENAKRVGRLKGHHGPIDLASFSHDGELVATYAHDSQIRIWDLERKQTLQVIDADGGRTVSLRWLPQGRLLLVASENGRIRIWGTPSDGESIGLKSIEPKIELASIDSGRSASSEQFKEVMDIRSFPRLPGAIPLTDQFYMAHYSAKASIKEATLFYRYVLQRDGWEETTRPDETQLRLQFSKNGFVLDIGIEKGSMTGLLLGGGGGLKVSLNFQGNYDARWLPQHQNIIKNNLLWERFGNVSYRTQGDLTDVEVFLLREFHKAGWTAYSILGSQQLEDPDSCTLYFLQGGSRLTVSVGNPAREPGRLSIQTTISVLNKTLPIPRDCGWVEFDSSTDLRFVGMTKMNLNEARTFYDQEMAREGWLSREAVRTEKDGKAWLPYHRGQQDMLIRLEAQPTGTTRILVGEVKHSWQLKQIKKIDSNLLENGIEAADFPVIDDAESIQFDVDQKKIEFDIVEARPSDVAQHFRNVLGKLGWKSRVGGVASDDYSLTSFEKGKAELDIRARKEDGSNGSAVSVAGDGLLWSKRLPTAPQRVSYGAWLRRNRHNASLDLLDEYAEEMQKVSLSN